MHMNHYHNKKDILLKQPYSSLVKTYVIRLYSSLPHGGNL